MNMPPLHEVTWHKSSYSGRHTDCVEIATPENVAAIRDTKHRDLGALIFDRSEWHAFLNTTKGRRC